jgi:hypothetical protein
MTVDKLIRALRLTARVLIEVAPVVLEAVIAAVRKVKRTSHKS